MAFDGITIANMVKEFQDTIVGGKINKIAQPEADELLITIKSNKTQYRLLSLEYSSLKQFRQSLWLTDIFLST